MISEKLNTRLHTIEYNPGLLSDHLQVKISIVTQLPSRGKGFWKQNMLHIPNKMHIEGIEQIMSNADDKYVNLTPDLRWEMLKNDIVNFSTSYSIAKSKRKKEKLENLEHTLNYLYSQFGKTQNEIFYQEAKEVEYQLEKFQLEMG